MAPRFFTRWFGKKLWSRPWRVRRFFRPSLEVLESRILLDASNVSFLQGVYQDLLHRPLDNLGLAVWGQMLQQGTSRQDVVRQIENSTEYRTDLIEELYTSYLHRPADQDGLNCWLGYLQGGGTVEGLEAGILGSTEFFQTQGGGTNAGFLQALYQDMLGRPVDSLGQQVFGVQLQVGVPCPAVAWSVITSWEGDTDTVEGFYQTYLGYPADAQGQEFWVLQLQMGAGQENVLADILGSQAFFNQSGSGTESVAVGATGSTGAGATGGTGQGSSGQPPAGTLALNITSPLNNSQDPATVSLTGSAGSAAVSAQFSLDGGALTPLTLGPGGSFDQSLSASPLTAGPHQLIVEADDAAKNQVEQTIAFTVSQLPTGTLALNITSPLDNSQDPATVSLTGSAGSAAVSAQFSLDGGALTPLTLGPGGSFDQSLSASPLAAGPHQLIVEADDATKNQVEQTINFTVNANTLQLVEQNSLVTQATVPVVLGGSQGSRTLSFTVTPTWDTPTQSSISGDRLLVSLAATNPTIPTPPGGDPFGTPLFTLTSAGETEYTPGQVRYDGSTVQIDVTSLSADTSGQLLFQLVNGDGATGSSVQIGPLSDTVDPNGTASPVYAAQSDTTVSAGPALDLSSLSATTNVTAFVSQVHVDATLGLYTAELRVQNNGTDVLGKNLAVVFPGLPAGVQMLSASGTDGTGAPYINLANAVGTGLAAGDTSGAVDLTISDPSLVPFSLQPQILVGPAEEPPVLAPVGPLSVAPGGYLSVQLQASDPNGNPITYSLRGSNLPTGSLQADGTLIFQPDPSQIGTYNFQVVASDGPLQAVQPVTLTVTGTPQSTTSISGIVEDSNGNPVTGVPISLGNVQTTTAADGSYTLTFTGPPPDDWVNFHGDEVNGTTRPGFLMAAADPAGSSVSYTGFSESLSQLIGHDVYSGYNNVVGQSTQLISIDTADAVTVDPSQTTTVTNSALAGSSLVIPANSLRDQYGNLYTGKVSLTSVPVNQIPTGLLSEDDPTATGATQENPAVAVTLQAVGSPGTYLSLSDGTLTLPNTGGYQPGSQMQLKGTDPVTGRIGVVETSAATVSKDGKTVTAQNFQMIQLNPPPPGPIPPNLPPQKILFVDPKNLQFFGISSSTTPAKPTSSSDPPCNCQNQVTGPDPTTNGSPGGTPPKMGPTGTTGVPTDVFVPTFVPTPDPSPWTNLQPITTLVQQANGQGSLQQNLPITSYQSQGVGRELMLHYESMTADPTNIIHLSDAVNGGTYGASNPLLTTSLTINNGTFSYQLPGASAGSFGGGAGLQFFKLPSGGNPDVGLETDTSSLPTGAYTYNLTVGLPNYNSASGVLSGTTSTTQGSMIVVNNQDSPFGSGWGLSGWEEVVPGANDSVLLVDGDGSRLLYTAPTIPGGAYTPPDGHFSTLVRRADGTFQNTLPDQTVYSFNSDGQLATITDSNGNTTTFGYDASGNLTSVTDPVGQTTTFSYSGGMVDAVTAPDGQTTQLQHDGAGNLTGVALPATPTQHLTYDSQHLLTSLTEPNGHTLYDTYGVAGRVTAMSDSAGTTVRISTPDVQDVVPTTQAPDPANPPQALTPQPFVQSVTDGNGNVIADTLDSEFQLVSWSGAGGVGTTYQRSQDLITGIVDGDGHVQLYDYAHGNTVKSLVAGPAGAVVTGAITQPAEQRSYTFTGTAGEQLYYQNVSADPGISYQLAGPGSVTYQLLPPEVAGQPGSSGIPAGQSALWTLGTSGTYTLTFTGTQAGTFSFEVSTFVATPLALNTPIDGSLYPSQGSDFYQISGSAGEQLLFHSLNAAADVSGSWAVFGTSDTPLASNDLGEDLSVTLPAAGTYLLALSPATNLSAPGSFDFEVESPTTTTAPLTLGTVSMVTIGVPGDTRQLTFTGQVGQRLFLDTPSGLGAQLLAPDGTTVFPPLGDNENSGPVTLAQAGTYTVSVTGSTPGAYSVLVSDVTSVPVLPLGTDVSGQLSPGSAPALYRFSGKAGQQLQINLEDEPPDLQWTFYGPENQVVANQAAPDASAIKQPPDFSATLPEDGTYVLVGQQTDGGSTADYQFWVQDTTPAPVAATGFGTVHSGTLGPGQQATFTYTGSAGLPVFLDDQSTPNTGIYYTLQDANGVPVELPPLPVIGSQDVGPFTLPATGTYTLVVNNGATGVTLPYQVRLLDLTTDALPLTLGQSVSATLTAPYQTDVYQLGTTTNPGQLLYYENLSTAPSSANLELTSLGGDMTPDIQFSNLDASSDQMFVVHTGGTRYLVLSSQQAGSLPYSFRLLDPTTAPTLTANSPVSSTLSTSNPTDLYQFSGTAGEYVYFNTSNLNGEVNLYGPQGNAVNSFTLQGFTLPFTGTYYLAVAGSNLASGPDNYTVEFTTPATTTAALTVGAATSGTLNNPGDRNLYTFTATAGERAVLGLQSAFTTSATLLEPDGSSVGLSNVTTLTETGTYTLTITGTAPDSYQFRLSTDATATALTAGTPASGAFPFYNDQVLYSFAGTAGERVRFASTNASWTVYTPDGQTLSFSPSDAVLSATGTYLIAVSPSFGGTFPLDYSFEVLTPKTTQAALTPGTSYSGTLSGNGDEEQFTFTGTAGQQLYYDDLGGSGSLTENLTDPSGASVASFTPGNDADPVTLPASGTYTLMVEATAAGSNTYAFRLLDPASATALGLGATVNGTLNPGGATNLYQLTGIAGQRLSFTIPASDPSTSAELYGPNGNLVGQMYPDTSGTFTAFLPMTGTYVLAVQGNSTSGPVTYSVQATDISDQPVATSGFGTIQGGTLAASGLTTFTFTGPEGLPVLLDNQDAANSQIAYQVTDPSGNVVFGASSYGSGSSDSTPVPYLLENSGTYTVEVDNNGSDSAPFSFRMLDLSTAPALTPGTAVSGTLSPGTETAVYTLAGTAGMRLLVDPSGTALNGASAELWEPSNLGSLSLDFQPPLTTMPVNGTYYLTVQGAQAGATGYSVQLDDVSSLPVLAAGTTLTGTSPSYYQFTGTAGEELYFANGSSNPVGNYTLNLYGPDNNTINSTMFGNGYLVTLPASGTYVLAPFTSSTTPADYNFQLSLPTTITTPLSLASGVSSQYSVTYDSVFNRPTSVTDARGDQTLYQLDPKTGNVLTVTQVAASGNAVTHYTYTAGGQVQTETDPDGNVTQYAYDSLGRMTQVTSAVGTLAQATMKYAYDAAGNVTAATDANGHVTTYQYDAWNRLVQQTDPLGNVTKYGYDANGNLTAVTDPLDRATTYVYDGGNRVAQKTAPDGGVTHYSYDGAGNLTAVVDPLGHETQYRYVINVFDYDVASRLTAVIDAAGGTTRTAYDNAGNVTATADANGHTTTYAYDTRNELISTTDPLGKVTHYYRDAYGNVTATTDANGHWTFYRYDALNRLTSETDALGHTTTYAYDPASNLIAETDPNGHTTKYAYDAQNRLTATTDPLGNVTTDRYDAAGNLTAVSDALGRMTLYAYDPDNRLTSTTDAAGGRTTLAYDAAGEITAETDALGQTTKSAYDVMGQVTRSTDALGQVTTMAYDKDGNLLSVTDPLGHQTRYSYDVLNRLTRTADALGGTLTDAYDAAGNLTAETDQLGHTTTYGYDADNRLTRTTDALGGKVTDAYDAVGNLTAETDQLGHTTTYTYDAVNRLTLTTDALGGTVTDAYDAAGNLTAETDQLGQTTRYAYDADNRLTLTTDALGGTVTDAYDAVGNLTSETDQLGHTTKYGYDRLNRLTATTDPLGNITTTAYDAVGNVTAQTDPLGHTTKYAFDADNRLTLTTDALGGTVAEAYDAAGNLTAETDQLGHTTTYGYDALNRQTSTTDPLGNTMTTAYDAADNVTARTDALGRVTKYAYDALNRLTLTTDALGGTVADAYDAAGNLTSETDQLGHITTYSYDALNRLTLTTDALGGTVADAYDAAGNLTAETDQLGHTTKYGYDALNRQTSTTDPLGNISTTAYDAAGNVTAQTDTLGRTTSAAYDADNRLTLTTDALGGTVADAYDAVGNLTAETDQLGRTTTFGYDALNRQTSTTDPLGNTTTTAYDAAGNVTAQTDALGQTTTYGYDSDNRLALTTDALGGTVADAYDAVGNLTAETDQLGRTTQYGYDALNRQTTTTDPLGNITTTTYDAIGNTLSVTDPLGHETQYGYDALNRLTSTTDPIGSVTRNAYDAAGNLTGVTDPDGNVTTYAYDAANRMTAETTPLGTSTYAYDPVGNLTVTTDRDGHTIQYTYDKLNRQTAENWLDSSGKVIHTFTYTYDAAGELTSAGDGTSSYQFSYDAAGQTTSVSNAGTAGAPTVVMAYAYDKVGNVLSRSDTVNGNAAGTTAYSYDNLDRMTQVTQSGLGVTAKRADFTYDAASEMTGITRYSDLAGTQQVAATQLGYDKAGRLTSRTDKHSSTTLAAYTWTYDAAGRITSDTSPDGSDTYTYDASNQLTGATHTSAQPAESYSFDNNGNRTNTGYKTGPDNEVLSDGTYNYGYDANGNLTLQTDIATGAQTVYQYDYRNRLTEVTFKDGTGKVLKDVTYTYDVFNNRIGETVTDNTAGTTTTTRFIYDGTQVALTFDGSGTLTGRYLYGPGQNNVLAGENGQGQVLWALTDNLGSVRDLIDSTGTIEDHILYDSFGNITSESNAALDFLFAYAGQQRDPATGLNYDQARFYNALLGRFMSQDRSGFTAGDPNLYRYVGNDPINAVDPSGLDGGPACTAGQKTPPNKDKKLQGQVEQNSYRDPSGKEYTPVDYDPETNQQIYQKANGQRFEVVDGQEVDIAQAGQYPLSQQNTDNHSQPEEHPFNSQPYEAKNGPESSLNNQQPPYVPPTTTDVTPPGGGGGEGGDNGTPYYGPPYVPPTSQGTTPTPPPANGTPQGHGMPSSPPVVTNQPPQMNGTPSSAGSGGQPSTSPNPSGGGPSGGSGGSSSSTPGPFQQFVKAAIKHANPSEFLQAVNKATAQNAKALEEMYTKDPYGGAKQAVAGVALERLFAAAGPLLNRLGNILKGSGEGTPDEVSHLLKQIRQMRESAYKGGELRGAAQLRADSAEFSMKQLQQKFKHAPDFGGPTKSAGTTADLREYEQALRSHLANPETLPQGTYANIKGSTVYFNPSTNNVVVLDTNQRFVTGFKLQPGTPQYTNFVNNGFLK